MDNKKIIFIHGYTGGMTDFADVPEMMQREFGVSVSCPALPGHGTSIDDLEGVTLSDLLLHAEQEVKKAVDKHEKVILVGLSMGAQIALFLASKYPVSGVVSVAITHELMFPFNIPGISFVGLFKRRWKKRFTDLEKELRAKATFYTEMLFDGFHITRELNRLVEKRLSLIRQPVFFIHARYERLGSPNAVIKLSRYLPGKTAVRFFDSASHNVFYSEIKNDVAQAISKFIREEKLLENSILTERERERVSVVVPAYNEAERIDGVLAALIEAPSIDEIIVVDDGSHDGTWEKIGNFKNVKRLRNEKNLGKAASMERGVREAKHDIIFFCDADLIDFRSEHAEAIIAPVREGRYDMYIGMRGNFMQRTVKAWGLNSGERALRRYVWEKLPAYYKHRYRVEAGLNHYVRKYTENGLGWGMFDYSQPVKEKKHGLVKGTLLRWWMNFDVVSAYLSYPLIARFVRQKADE